VKKRLLIGFGVIFAFLVAIFFIRILAISNNPAAQIAVEKIQNVFPVIKYIPGLSSQKSSQISTIIDGTNYEIESQIPEYRFSSSEIDSNNLQTYLQKLDLLPLRNKEFLEYDTSVFPVVSRVRKADYKTIRVVLRPMSSLPPNFSDSRQFPFLQFYKEQLSGDFVIFFGGKNTNDTFEIPLYINEKTAQTLQGSPDSLLSYYYLKTLYLNFNDQTFQTSVPAWKIFDEKINEFPSPFFSLSHKISLNIGAFFNTSLQKTKELLIPQAYAACSGTVTCGTWTVPEGHCSGTTSKKCSIGGTSCTDNSDCTYGSCQTVTSGNNVSCPNSAYCQSNGYGSSCIQQSAYCSTTGASYVGCSPQYSNSVLECRANCGSCTLGACNSGNTCTWGPYGPCSLPCGGGVQYRTDNCGNTSAPQACNTQACSGGGGCTPSCPRACGDPDGCGGTCSSSSAGTPGAITGQTPPDGSAATPLSGSITLDWDPPTLASVYEIQVYPTGTPSGQECTVANHHCPSAFSQSSYTFAVDQGVTSYTWRVRAINNACTTTVGPWTTAIDFSVGGNITGNFYLDDSLLAQINPATGLCELASPVSINPGSGPSILARWNTTQTATGTITDSTYSIENVGYDPNTQIIYSPVSPYTCTCPSGCSYSGVSAPLDSADFYISSSRSAWWQTRNGLLYSGNTSGSSILSKIPDSCASPNCTPALSTKNIVGATNSEGFVISGGGTVDTTVDTGTQYSYLREDGGTAHIQGVTLKGTHENYTYFSQLYSMGSSPTGDTLDAGKPALSPTNGRAYYSTGDLAINTAWAVDSGQSLVVFVNGNLTVNQTITVAEGGFLAFIVKGDITFGATVGQSSVFSTTPVVEGVYISDQQIIVASNGTDDLKFVGAGMFIGWGGVQLNREFSPASENNTAPAELFIYRPDLILSIPDRMTRPYQLWQETNL
jgi:hypothetical protein